MSSEPTSLDKKKNNEEISINKTNKDGSSENFRIEEIDNGYILSTIKYNKDYKEISKSKMYYEENPLEELEEKEETKPKTTEEIVKLFEKMNNFNK